MHRVSIALGSLFLLPAALSAQQPRPWRLQPVATIGGAEANDERYTFDRVINAGLAGRRDGHLLVVDAQGKRVLEFDGAGNHVRTMGRSGAGPGEFQYPSAAALAAGDSLWVYDIGHDRYTIFPPGGGTPRTLRASVNAFGRFRIAGGTLVHALAANPRQGGMGSGSMVPERTVLALMTTGAIVRDTVWSGPTPRRVLVTVQNGRSSHSTHATEQFGIDTHWDQLRDGTLVIADTTTYLVRLVSREGRVVGTIGSGEPGRPVTGEDREQVLARRAEELKNRRPADPRFALPEALQRKVLEQTPFAPVVPRVAGVAVDPDDRIWVGVAGSRGVLERIDIYDRAGRLVARVSDPPAMPVALYGDGLAAVLERDEFDAQRIRIMRVVQ